MIVKIKLAETLDEGINSYIGFKNISKLGPKNVLKKLFRNLKAGLITIPLFKDVMKKDLFNIHVPNQTQNNKFLLMMMEI